MLIIYSTKELVAQAVTHLKLAIADAASLQYTAWQLECPLRHTIITNLNRAVKSAKQTKHLYTFVII